jgi:HEXXH motif-containing protein
VTTEATAPAPLELAGWAFLELAHGKASPAVVSALWDGEWSRRLVMLRAFNDIVSADPALFGPLPAAGAAWQALEDAQAEAPAEVRALILHPQVGSWLAYALRRHRASVASPAPAHIDFGQFHTLALAAAALARQPFATVVPLREGRVMVPRLGMAHFPGAPAWDVAEAGTEDGRIWIRHGGHQIDVPAAGSDTAGSDTAGSDTAGSDADGSDADGAGSEGWWSLRKVTVGESPALTVWLDDLDPMRDLADPVAPARLNAAELARWTELLTDAWRILTRDHADLASALAAGVTSLVPLPSANGWDTRSASTGEAFGAILCTLPPDAETLAVSLAHEQMHILLGGLMHLLPLTETAGVPALYAPWRDDPRPAGGLLQGIYAFFGIAAFWRRQRRGNKLHDFEYAYARTQTAEALEIVRAAGGLTAHGEAFTDGLAEELASWWSDDLDDEAAALAALVADGHRAGWRIRNCRPAASDIAALAGLWMARTKYQLHIGASEVLPDPAMRHWSPARLGLARRRLSAPDRFHDTLAEDWAAGLTDADLALFAGDVELAVKGFAEQLIADPEAVDAWTGLGLALNLAAPGPASRILIERPEVVLALHRRLARNENPAPLDLADWVGTTAASDPRRS